MIEIDTNFRGESHVEQRVVLDGRDYVMRFDWSQRDGHWFLGLYDAADGRPIITGIKLVSHWRLLGRRTEALRPPGELLVIDPQTPIADPSFSSLGDRHLLVYIEQAEVAE